MPNAAAAGTLLVTGKQQGHGRIGGFSHLQQGGRGTLDIARATAKRPFALDRQFQRRTGPTLADRHGIQVAIEQHLGLAAHRMTIDMALAVVIKLNRETRRLQHVLYIAEHTAASRNLARRILTVTRNQPGKMLKKSLGHGSRL